MKKFFITAILFLFCITTFLYAEQSILEKIPLNAISKSMLEPFTKGNIYKLYYDNAFGVRAESLIRNIYPAPAEDSEYYLGIKVLTDREVLLDIVPPHPYIIDDYLVKLSIWVYGKDFKGELYCLLRDINNKPYKIKLANLKFKGWKEFIVKIDPDIQQKSQKIERKEYLIIDRFQVHIAENPFNKTWYFLYLDNFMKYSTSKELIIQPDNW